MITAEETRNPVRLMYKWEVLKAGIDAVIEEDIDRINEVLNCPNFTGYVMSDVYSYMLKASNILKNERCKNEILKYQKYSWVYK